MCERCEGNGITGQFRLHLEAMKIALLIVGIVNLFLAGMLAGQAQVGAIGAALAGITLVLNGAYFTKKKP